MRHVRFASLATMICLALIFGLALWQDAVIADDMGSVAAAPASCWENDVYPDENLINPNTQTCPDFQKKVHAISNWDDGKGYKYTRQYDLGPANGICCKDSYLNCADLCILESHPEEMFWPAIHAPYVTNVPGECNNCTETSYSRRLNHAGCTTQVFDCPTPIAPSCKRYQSEWKDGSQADSFFTKELCCSKSTSIADSVGRWLTNTTETCTTCTDEERNECTSGGGTFDESTCECTYPPCDPDGSQQASCEAAGNTWNSQNCTCDPNPCSQQNQDACAAQGWYWNSAWCSCDPPTPDGCNPNDESNCSSLNGTWDPGTCTCHYCDETQE